MGTQETPPRVQLSCWKAHWGIDWPGFSEHDPQISAGNKGELQGTINANNC